VEGFANLMQGASLVAPASGQNPSTDAGRLTASALVQMKTYISLKTLQPINRINFCQYRTKNTCQIGRNKR